MQLLPHSLTSDTTFRKKDEMNAANRKSLDLDTVPFLLSLEGKEILNQVSGGDSTRRRVPAAQFAH